ncbi:hypothetical protein Tco_0802237 [Tanacetum coccineum]|uniref:Uncharacterized protein n=1 Tax=Tanacetum coccineum TaxID=301880 RepID=A0ABQ4ZY80_9ASTR
MQHCYCVLPIAPPCQSQSVSVDAHATSRGVDEWRIKRMTSEAVGAIALKTPYVLDHESGLHKPVAIKYCFWPLRWSSLDMKGYNQQFRAFILLLNPVLNVQSCMLRVSIQFSCLCILMESCTGDEEFRAPGAVIILNDKKM